MTYLEELFSLQGKVCLVSGASRGIGAAIAHALHLVGGTVIGVGRSEKPANEKPWRYEKCDINDGVKVSQLCAEVHAEYGTLDVLVNAAGITQPKTSSGDASDNFRETLETNLVSIHGLCSQAANYMKLAGGGSIINITSIGSVMGFPGNPAYVASKGGLRMLTKALAFDYGADGIRVNNIAPGYIKTNMTSTSYEDPDLHKERLNKMLIPRWGQPLDLCGAAIYLASDASGYVTGIDLFVDGGWTIKGI